MGGPLWQGAWPSRLRLLQRFGELHDSTPRSGDVRAGAHRTRHPHVGVWRLRVAVAARARLDASAYGACVFVGRRDALDGVRSAPRAHRGRGVEGARRLPRSLVSPEGAGALYRAFVGVEWLGGGEVAGLFDRGLGVIEMEWGDWGLCMVDYAWIL